MASNTKGIDLDARRLSVLADAEFRDYAFEVVLLTLKGEDISLSDWHKQSL